MTQMLNSPLDTENYSYTVFRWRDRQAGVSLVFDPTEDRYFYNAYCIETKIYKELFSCEFEFLDDAIKLINQEYGNWEVQSLDSKGCGSCAAKK
jgi:hypothetical protein